MKIITRSFALVCLLLVLSNLEASNELFMGYWIGSIRVMENELEIHTEFLQDAETIKGLITIPGQFLQDLELSEVEIDYPEISFKLDQLHPHHSRVV